MSSSISRLPESATQLLGSHGVITSPVSLVKELLDNSIDAQATSVEVIISANTVSKIEVRDNGVGIHPDDYDALGRRSHTSKLRTLEQLRMNAGTTLGFRGEALASANCMAIITITTKTSTEPVAAVLQILPNTGGVAKQQPISAPTGTTVSVTDLFGRLPVREQVATKEARKTLDKIQQLLRAYAMARPQLKISFKVLQMPKHNWSYAPKPHATVKEAAIQIFGVELSAHCFEKTVQVSSSDDANSPLANRKPLIPGLKYSFEAFIIKPGADIHKISKHAYFSVDGRPLSAEGVTTRKLLSIYSEFLSMNFQKPSSTIPSCSFISLNIECPPGSYDVNIEPSKDDVLFSDESIIISGFQSLCEDVYKPIEINHGDSQLKGPPSSSPLDDVNIVTHPSHPTQALWPTTATDFPEAIAHISSFPMSDSEQLPECSNLHNNDRELSRETQISKTGIPEALRLTPTSESPSIPPTRNKPRPVGIISEKPISTDTARTGFKVDMSINHNERVNQSHCHKRNALPVNKLPRPKEISGEAEGMPAPSLNPWVISKMNAACKQIHPENVATRQQGSASVPTIEPSVTPDLPILRHSMAPPTDLDFPLGQRLKLQAETTQQRPLVPGGHYHSPISSPTENKFQEASTRSSQLSNKTSGRRHPLPWSPPSSTHGGTNPRSPLDSSYLKNTINGLKQTEISFGATKANPNRRRGRGNDENDQSYLSEVSKEVPSDQNNLQEMFESARHNLNYQLSQLDEGSSIPKARECRPHRTCSLGEHRAQPFVQLRTNTCQEDPQTSRDKKPIATTLPDGDPRTYLLRRQKSISANPRKLRRIKSSLMPLESVPPEDQTHSLS